MMAVINVIKTDKREQFEDYVRKFDAAAAKVSVIDPAIKQMVTQTRLLKATKANEDGTFTYIWLMDPLVEGAVYDMGVILEKAMPKADADALIQQFTDSIIVERQ
jgi:hypothetical protein